MKAIKKVFAILLAAVMTLGLSVTAFAAGTTSTTGTITITNAASGETYTIYKVFDLTYSDSYKATTYDANSGVTYYTKNNDGTYTEVTDPANETGTLYVKDGTNVSYTYTKAEENDALYTALAGENSPFTLTASVKENVYKVSLKNSSTTGATIVDFLKSLVADKTLTTTIDSKEAPSNGTLKFESLDLGYYYIATTNGAAVTIDSTTPDVEVVDKNVLPQIKKEVQEGDTWGETNDASIGDTVTFQVTITTEGEPKDYVLHDTMSDGLTFGEVTSITWTKNGGSTETTLDVDTDYTLAVTGLTDNCDFEIEFTDTFLEKVGAYDTIVVSYTATVNKNAVIKDTGNPNTAELNYTNNYDVAQTIEDTTRTYVYDVDVFKFTMKDEAKTALSGAEFVLYKTVTEPDTTTDPAGTKDVNYYAKVESDKLTGWTKTKSEATTLTSGEDGKISVDGLDADTYYLEETKAPAGYNLLADPVTIVIDEDGKVKVDNTEVTTVEVENKTGTELPSTGGMGTTIFYVVGSILVVGAAVLLIVKKRMSGAEE